MESSTVPSLGPVEDGPDSWEVADVDASMRRLMLSSRKESTSNVASNQADTVNGSDAVGNSASGFCMSEALINTVDQFLREAIQNPRERLSG